MTVAIDEKYAELGGANGFLGAPSGPELVAPDGVGHFRSYAHGSIYSTDTTGAHEVHGLIRDEWGRTGWERGPLGYPTSDESDIGDAKGRFNAFQFGVMDWTPETGAHEAHGAISAKYAALGGPKGFLGYPVDG